MTQSIRRQSGCIPILLLMLILVGVLVIGFYRGISKVETNFGKPDPRLGIFQQIKQTFLLYRAENLINEANALQNEIKFVVDFAEPATSICARLEAESAVANAQTLCSYLIYKGLDRDLQAGQFTILPQTTLIQVAERIADPSLKDVLFTVYPGWRLEEIANSISLAGYSDSFENIASFFKSPGLDLRDRLHLLPGISLEGYLCPGNYSVKPETQLNELVIVLTECQLSYLSDNNLLDNINTNGFNYHQAITLASIIQRETLDTNEMPMIASVFNNRLAQGMMLQTDPTVQYALGYDDAAKSWWKSPLTIADLEIESPYNTYRVYGLPPGPISTPSEEALMAVVNPAVTDYFYFRAKCDGSLTHAFSQTYEEHLSNACP